MSRLIKRYGNRKLYDTQTSRYVTLERIAEMVRQGEDLRILDNATKEDLTALTFAQIIFEEEKRRTGLLELPVLRWIIQQGGATMQDILHRVDRGRAALENVREFAEKGMRQFWPVTDQDHDSPARAKRRQPIRASSRQGLLDDMLEAPQRQLEHLQQRLDAQIRASIERVMAHPTVRNELRRIERSVKNLEHQLGRLRPQEKRRHRQRRQTSQSTRGRHVGRGRNR